MDGQEVTKFKATLRDKIVQRLANFVLLFATKEYRQLLDGLIKYGMYAVARDIQEGRPSPEHWSAYVLDTSLVKS